MTMSDTHCDTMSTNDSDDSSRRKMDEPYSRRFFEKSNADARRIYFKVLLSGCFLVIFTILAILAIYWGALWKTPVGSLNAWVVDFDGGIVGRTFVQALTANSMHTKVHFSSVPSSEFLGGVNDLGHAVIDQKAWAIVSINAGASARLQASYSSPDAAYNGSDALTVYAAEARNENAYRVIIRPYISEMLSEIGTLFATQAAKQLSSSSTGNVSNILATSPQTIVTPVSYTTQNVAPFDHPVATAVTFVGLIYMVILSLFIVMISTSARQAAGFDRVLTLRSLIVSRLVSSFAVYFIISLFYSLLSLAFQVSFSKSFGKAGFVVFWMVNWVGMLSVGLALESMITILTARFIPFFMVILIIVNVSVSVFPIEVLPSIYRYGYSMPFYNVSHAVRSIVFGTKNQIGQNFGILLAWVCISCITLPFLQWFVRRKEIIAVSQKEPESHPQHQNQLGLPVQLPMEHEETQGEIEAYRGEKRQ